MYINDFNTVEAIIQEALNPIDGWRTAKNRKIENIEPKQIAYWVLYYYTDIPLKEIGFYFGRSSYSNVSTSVKEINNRSETDYSFSCRLKKVMSGVESSGYQMVNRDGRKQYAKTKQNRAFSGRFKQDKTPPKRPQHSDYDRCIKPEIRPINGIEMVPCDVIDKRIIKIYGENDFNRNTAKAVAFEEGVCFAEDEIKPTYKQLLDFYNSVPKVFFTLKEDVTQHTN